MLPWVVKKNIGAYKECEVVEIACSLFWEELKIETDFAQQEKET